MPDTSPVTIAQVIDTDGPGGAEQVVAHLSTALHGAGARSVALLPRKGEGWLPRRLEGTGVTVDYFQADGSPLSCVRSLEAALRRQRAAIAHSHEFAMAVCGAAACRLVGIPHLFTMHGGRYYAERLRRRVALRAAIAMSGCAVAVSAHLARHVSHDLRLRRSRVRTIPNGVRYVRSASAAMRRELRLGSADRLLVAVGNLYPVKGHQHLIDALARLAWRYPTAHVAISGRGELADALAARAEGWGLGRRVHLLGLRSDIPAILAAADVFVLPSLSEGLPLALLEAMCAGCPIVASDVGDVRTALAGGEAGVLVNAGDPEALAAALDGVLRDPDRARALGERAARRAAAEYDLSHMVRRYMTLYQGLLGHPVASPDRLAAAAPPTSGLELEASL